MNQVAERIGINSISDTIIKDLQGTHANLDRQIEVTELRRALTEIKRQIEQSAVKKQEAVDEFAFGVCPG